MAVVLRPPSFPLVPISSLPCHPPPLFLFLFLLLLLLPPLSSSAPSEAEALISLKNKFTNNAALSSWDPKSVPCQGDTSKWAGIVCNHGSVTALHLGSMSLSGEVDVEALLHLPGLRSISLVNNSLEGPMPEFNRLGALKSLFLTGNHFTGDIPDDFFGNMDSLKKVWLSHNAFTGAIPKSLSDLSHLIELRLEHNQFSGPLMEFTQPSLSSFNVSDNPKLQGQIPASLEKFDKSSFSDNPGLCGEKAGKACGDPGASGADGGEGSGKSKVIGLSLIVILCLVSLVVLAAKKSRDQDFDTLGRDHGEDVVEVCVSSHNNRPKGSGHSSRRGMDASGHHRKDSHSGGKKSGFPDIIMVNEEKGVFGLQDLMKAAAEVLGSNGSGNGHSAYKAVMANGMAVAVKRMREMNRVGQDGFEAEMRRLGKLRHPNILTPLAFYYKKEEKLLVYEHVSGGSLHFLLHGNRGAELNWETRLMIVRGIIQGLAYLHAELPNADIPHGNLKSSNVLLGPDLNPLLADFGYSPLVIPTHASHSMFAYKSPESLQYRHVSPKSDVYCLGILILEILTGKYPSQYNNGGKGGTDLVEWVATAMKEKQELEVFDPEIAPSNDATRASMEALLHLGAECAEPNPERRPDIKEVLRRMEEIVTKSGG